MAFLGHEMLGWNEPAPEILLVLILWEFVYLSRSFLGRVTSVGRHSCLATVARSLAWNELWPQGSAAELPNRLNGMQLGRVPTLCPWVRAVVPLSTDSPFFYCCTGTWGFPGTTSSPKQASKPRNHL